MEANNIPASDYSVTQFNWGDPNIKGMLNHVYLFSIIVQNIKWVFVSDCLYHKKGTYSIFYKFDICDVIGTIANILWKNRNSKAILSYQYRK